MWKVTLVYATTHFNVLDQTRSGKSSPTSRIHQRTLRVYRTQWVLDLGAVECYSSTLSAHPQLTLLWIYKGVTRTDQPDVIMWVIGRIISVTTRNSERFSISKVFIYNAYAFILFNDSVG